MNLLGYSLHQWVFGVLSFITIVFALMVVFSRNPVNSVLYLVTNVFWHCRALPFT